MNDDTTARTFGVGQTRTVQVAFLVQSVVQGLLAADRWQDEGGPGVLTVLQIALAVSCPVAATFAEAGIVRVGDSRIRWRDKWLRHVNLAFDEVREIRKHPFRNRIEVLTDDDQTLTLPGGLLTGWEIRRLVLGKGPMPNFFD